jgi:hypothetical protein
MPGRSAGRAIGQPDFNKWRCGSRSSAERHSPRSSGVVHLRHQPDGTIRALPRIHHRHRPLASRTVGPIDNGRHRNFRKVNDEKKAFTLNVIASF